MADRVLAQHEPPFWSGASTETPVSFLEKRERSDSCLTAHPAATRVPPVGAPVRDAHYNLLRFIGYPDLGVDDSWDGYGIRPFTAGEMPGEYR